MLFDARTAIIEAGVQFCICVFVCVWVCACVRDGFIRVLCRICDDMYVLLQLRACVLEEK